VNTASKIIPTGGIMVGPCAPQLNTRKGRAFWVGVCLRKGIKPSPCSRNPPLCTLSKDELRDYNARLCHWRECCYPV
jgi:hypothetical protein